MLALVEHQNLAVIQAQQQVADCIQAFEARRDSPEFSIRELGFLHSEYKEACEILASEEAALAKEVLPI